jgi:hypothetical protein
MSKVTAFSLIVTMSAILSSVKMEAEAFKHFLAPKLSHGILVRVELVRG